MRTKKARGGSKKVAILGCATTVFVVASAFFHYLSTVHYNLCFHRHIAGNGGFLTRHNIEVLYDDVLKIHHFQRCADENIVDRAQIMDHAQIRDRGSSPLQKTKDRVY